MSVTRVASGLARARGRAALSGLLALGLLGAVATTSIVDPRAARADDDSTSPKIWMLELEHGHPKRVLIGKEPNVERYFYLPFTLKNVDSEAHSIFIEISAESDKGVAYRSVVSPAVLAKVRKLMGVEPFARLWSQEDLTVAHDEQPVPPELPTEIRLPRIPGGDTVACVAIFKGPDREMDRLKIRFRGLTNDVEVRKTDEPHERILRERVLVLEYKRLGDEFYAQEDPIEYVGRTWETQETRIKTDLD